MPVTVLIPTPLQKLTNGNPEVKADGGTIGDVVSSLEAQFPGIKERLCEGDGLRPGLAVVVDREVSRAGLRQAVGANSEVHFLPAIAGGGVEFDSRRAVRPSRGER